MTSFAVVTPSRGLIHSRTLAAVLANVEQAVAAGHVSLGWRLTHDLPIPTCHEQVVEAGLATGADILWMVEEDVVPPDGALLALLELGEPVAIVDYPVGANPTMNCASHRDGAICHSGVGCMVIAREVFERIGRPWFRSDRVYIRPGGQGPTQEVEMPVRYGGQDIYFTHALIKAGYRIAELPFLAGHARVREMGERQNNEGFHRIEVLTEVGRRI